MSALSWADPAARSSAEVVVARLIADAQAAAAAGEARRAMLLLALADEYASDEARPRVLFAWQALRAEVEGQGDGYAAGAARGIDRAAHVDAEVVPAAARGLPMPRLPDAPPALGAEGDGGLGPGGFGVWASAAARDAAVRRIERPAAATGESGRVSGAGGVWLGLGLACVLGVAAYAVFGGAGPGAGATGASWARQAGRGEALLEAGDTLGALAVWRVALDEVGEADAALAIARRAAAVAGGEVVAAEAYLRAFSFGVDRAVWEEVATAQERAGRPERAARVREAAAAGR